MPPSASRTSQERPRPRAEAPEHNASTRSGTRSVTSMGRDDPNAASRFFALTATSRASAPPGACGHVSHEPHASVASNARYAASPTSADSSIRPKHGTTQASTASAFATPAAASAVSHTTTGCPFVATMERLSCAVSSSSVGLRSSMAQVGHAVAHVPHPMQRSGSTTSSLPRSERAPDVHASTQRRQSALRLRTEMQRSSCTAMASLSMPLSRASTPSIRDMATPSPQPRRHPQRRPQTRPASRTQAQTQTPRHPQPRGRTRERARKRMRPAPCSAGRGT